MEIKEKINLVLKQAYPALKELKNDYFIIGSAALVLVGIPIETTFDIDIVTSKQDAVSLRDTWADKIIFNHISKESDLFRSEFARFRFELLDIEVMGNLEINKNGIWAKLDIKSFNTIITEDFEVKIPTLQEQIGILEFFGREKDLLKIQLIQNQIIKTKK